MNITNDEFITANSNQGGGGGGGGTGPPGPRGPQGPDGPAPSGMPGQIVYLSASSVANATSNLYWDSSNASVSIGTWPPSSNLQVNGNAYISNSLSTTNIFSVTSTISGASGKTSLSVTGNAYVSNALTTTNIFVNSTLFQSTALPSAITTGEMMYNSFMYGTNDATSGRGQVPVNQVFRLTTNLGATATTSSDFYGTSNAINLNSNSVYKAVFFVYFIKNTAGTVTLTANTSSAPIMMYGIRTATTGASFTTIGTPTFSYFGTIGTSNVVSNTPAALNAGTSHIYMADIWIYTNAATTLKIQCVNSAGTLTPLAGSWYSVTSISPTTGVFS